MNDCCPLCVYYFFILFHSDFIEYDDAAEEFHPFVKFVATFDPKVSSFFHLFMQFVKLLILLYTEVKKRQLCVFIFSPRFFSHPVIPDRQETETEAERGGLLRAVHGGARHHSGEALYRV